MKRALSWFLTLALVLGLIPASAMAQAVPAYTVTNLALADPEAADHEELFAGYAYQLFYGDIATYGSKAGDRLTGDEKLIYNALVPLIKQIAAGERSSTVIGLGQEWDLNGTFFGSDTPLTFTISDLSQEGLSRIMFALLTDMPYEMYWYDKVTGVTTKSLVGSVIVNLQFYFSVADNYQGDSEFTVDCAEARTAAAAAKNSAEIVAKYEGKSDYEKMVGYKTEICQLVEYNTHAAITGGFSLDNDPWQLIHVFDGDTTTNVVCEGYSKAFMYLCDQTDFSADISCVTVSGNMGGPHMWNIVTIGEKNYLVDVTNSESTTVGYDGSLFLAGGTGSVLTGYIVGGYGYTYDEATTATWGSDEDSVLALAAEAYNGEAVKTIAIGTCGETIEWVLDENGTLTLSGTGAIPNYATYDAPWYYEYNQQIEKVVIGSGITAVGTYVFAAHPNLKTVVLPESVTVLKDGAFNACEALTTITLPEKLTYIGQIVFSGCTQLPSLEIPETVTFIGDVAFAGTKVTSIRIPASVESLGNSAFFQCFDLTGIWVDAQNPNYSSDADGALYNKDQTLLYVIPGNISGRYTVAQSVTTIKNGAFTNARNLTEVMIHAGVASVAAYAFESLKNLTGIWVDAESPYYSNDDYGVLFNKDKTVLVRVPSTLEGVYTVPGSVTDIYPHAFQGSVLTGVVLQDGVKTLWQNAFIECRDLLTITLPASLEYVDGLVFTDSRNLTDVYYAGTLEQWQQIDIQNGNDPLLNATLHYVGMHEHTYQYVDAQDPGCDHVGWYAYRYCTTCDDTTYVEIPMLEHSYIGYLTPSTCVTQGYYTYICDGCGDEYTSELLPLSDHRWDSGVETLAPTEQTPGVRTYTCIHCPATKTEEIPILTHTHQYNAVVTPPTCTEQGYTTYTCACGNSYIGSYVNAKGHNVSQKWTVEVPAGCETEGLQVRKCSRCDYKESQILKPTGKHNYVATVTQPTCTEQGYTTYACTCGDGYVSDYKNPLDHDMGQWIEVTAANCHSGQIMRRDCSRCDHYETLEEGKPVHAMGQWVQIREASCTVSALWRQDCTLCDYYEEMQGPATNHEYKPTVVQPTATKPGYTVYVCHCGDSYEGDYTDALGLSAPKVSVVADAQTGKPVLSWGVVDENATYEIYRATSKTGKYTKEKTVSDPTWTDTTAAVGKTYYYKVKAVYAADPNLNSTDSNIVSLAVSCATPTLSAQTDTSGKPALTWNKVDGAKKYEVYRATTENGKYTKLTTITKTTYTDTKATTGNQYFYKVRAVASSATYNSGYSNIASCWIVCATPAVTAKVDSATGKPSFSWSSITGAVNYRVYRRGPGEEVFALIAEPTGKTFIDTAAAIDTRYEYCFQAAGKQAQLDSAKTSGIFVTSGIAAPKLSGSINENGKPVISWNTVEGANAYAVYRSTKSNKSYTLLATVSELSYTDISVDAGKTFYYIVVAQGENSVSANSKYVQLTGKCDIPQLHVEAGSTGKPVLTWNKIGGAKKYEIWRSVDGGTFKKLTTITKTTYTDTKATEGSNCTYRVKALGSNSKYNGNFSATDSCNVLCAAPTVTIKVNTVTGKPELSWKKITGATGYAIYRAVNDGEFVYVQTITGITFVDTAAEVDQKYSYKVVTVGKNPAFNSVESAVKTATATCAQPKITGVANEQGLPEITWDAVDGAVKYKIYRATSTSASKFKTPIATVTDLRFVDEVAVGKTYYYKVVAVSQSSESVISGYVKVVSKCAKPVASVGYNQDSGKPTLTWGKVTGAKKYEVWRSTSRDSGFKKLATVTTTTYSDTKATVGTFYYYQVRAIGSSTNYNSVFSKAVGCLTVCAKPVVTVKVDAAAYKPSLSWKAVDGAVAYEVYRAIRGGNFVYVATVTKPGYLDTNAQLGYLYRYQVKAVGSLEICQNTSEQVVISIPCKKTTITGLPSENGKPTMTWEAVDGVDIYVVYRSTKKDSGFKQCMQTTETTYFDRGAKAGTTYYYYVTAMAQDTESEKSNVIRLVCTE